MHRSTTLFTILSMVTTLLAACASPSAANDGGPDSSSGGCGAGGGAARAAPIPCATSLGPPGACRNEVLSPVCISNFYQCPAGTVRRSECTCFDDACEAGVDGGGDATAADGSAGADGAGSDSGASDATAAD